MVGSFRAYPGPLYYFFLMLSFDRKRQDGAGYWNRKGRRECRAEGLEVNRAVERHAEAGLFLLDVPKRMFGEQDVGYMSGGQDMEVGDGMVVCSVS